MPNPLFETLIVSRTSATRQSRHHAAALATAILLHGAGIAALILAPFLGLEPMQPPKALTMRPVLLLPSPSTLTAGRGDHGRAARIRRGGGAPRPATPTSPPRLPAPAPVRQPLAIPLEPPKPATDIAGQTPMAAIDSIHGLPGLPPGPGLPDGTGSSLTGTRDGCQGEDCLSGGRDGPGLDDGYDGPLYEGDPRITQPVLIPGSRAVPKYPDLARRATLQGSVILMITIEPDGTVGEVQVIRGPDQRWGFDLAAIEAVKRWRYRPALLDGRPVAVYAQVMVEFTLAR